jgi:ABC-type multidrug transport system permease subunit
MAFMVGTTWFDLPLVQSAVQDRYSVFFFTIAFQCLMSAAGIPAFIEQKEVYDRETSNAFYDVLPYVLSNTLVSLPFLLFTGVIYTSIAYPLIQLHPGFNRIAKFYISLFLCIYTAESIALIISAIFPVFIIALVVNSCTIGLFTVVQGYLVSINTLPPWLRWAHCIAFQTYGFEMMLGNDFPGLMFSCAPTVDGCFCSIPSSYNSVCQISGQDALNANGYYSIDYWNWFWVLIAQVIAYKILFFAVLWF